MKCVVKFLECVVKFLECVEKLSPMHLDGSKLPNISSVVLIKISENNLNRLLFKKASAFSSSAKSSPSSDSTTQTITSRHLILFVFVQRSGWFPVWLLSIP